MRHGRAAICGPEEHHDERKVFYWKTVLVLSSLLFCFVTENELFFFFYYFSLSNVQSNFYMYVCAAVYRDRIMCVVQVQ